ncbi:hypothetical protein PILCRDRAFT_113279 [Piloderma croceum F 1598]|uniref:IRG-type G domain-containing protein n=1 Tax=Piloderma croceum (strain F 1598) TaxID=765440 RepID=A0A0C3C007_PILCF|nr:hypothetical protein PILCRDRAFT_113279 [Piloderma croceum F 1598]
MGSAVSAVAVSSAVSAVAGSLLVVASVVVKLIDVFRSRSIGANPTIEAIEEEAHKQAQVEIDKAIAQQEAERQAWQVEIDMARRAQEEAERQAWQVGIDMARRAQEEAERTAAEVAQRAREAQEEAERQARGKEDELNQVNATRKEVERKWREGIQPEVWPTKEELQTAQKRLQHTGDTLHFAVAGAAGSGKSSLINAFCGLRNKDPGAARTGIVETTSKIARYPDPTPGNPFVWYDVPGAGTLAIPDWEYFNAQGLYIFDCIIVLFDNRFTTIDVAILKHCARFKIPTYIVRSKSNQHIENMVQDMYESDDEDGNQDNYQAELYAMARDKYIEETRQSVRINLGAANLPQQKVYIVSKDTLLNLVKRLKVPKDAIDELELLKDLLSDALARRGVGKNRSSS